MVSNSAASVESAARARDLRVGAQEADVGHRRRRRGLLGGGIGFGPDRVGGDARGAHALVRRGVEERLREVRADVDGMHRADHLAIGIEEGDAVRSGEGEAEGGGVEGAPPLDRRCGEVGEEVGAPLADAGVGLRQAGVRDIDRRVLAGGELHHLA